ncbi:MAG: hypothetical protein IJ452_03090 [Butyricicoccus sp.]|nr:hypothetical protein [Butyricicoccus sp.]
MEDFFCEEKSGLYMKVMLEYEHISQAKKRPLLDDVANLISNAYQLGEQFANRIWCKLEEECATDASLSRFYSTQTFHRLLYWDSPSVLTSREVVRLVFIDPHRIDRIINNETRHNGSMEIIECCTKHLLEFGLVDQWEYVMHRVFARFKSSDCTQENINCISISLARSLDDIYRRLYVYHDCSILEHVFFECIDRMKRSEDINISACVETYSLAYWDNTCTLNREKIEMIIQRAINLKWSREFILCLWKSRALLNDEQIIIKFKQYCAYNNELPLIGANYDNVKQGMCKIICTNNDLLKNYFIQSFTNYDPDEIDDFLLCIINCLISQENWDCLKTSLQSFFDARQNIKTCDRAMRLLVEHKTRAQLQELHTIIAQISFKKERIYQNCLNIINRAKLKIVE